MWFLRQTGSGIPSSSEFESLLQAKPTLQNCQMLSRDDLAAQMPELPTKGKTRERLDRNDTELQEVCTIQWEKYTFSGRWMEVKVGCLESRVRAKNLTPPRFIYLWKYMIWRTKDEIMYRYGSEDGILTEERRLSRWVGKGIPWNYPSIVSMRNLFGNSCPVKLLLN